jgi:hypothetical protein
MTFGFALRKKKKVRNNQIYLTSKYHLNQKSPNTIIKKKLKLIKSPNARTIDGIICTTVKLISNNNPNFCSQMSITT